MSQTGSTEQFSSLSHGELVKISTNLQQEVELLKFKFEELQRYVYGKRSEKQICESPEQEKLFALPETQQQPEYQDVKGYKKKKSSKKKIPEDLPVEQIIYEPEQSECEHCGEQLIEFSRDVRSELEFIPSRFFRKEHITLNCSCPKCKIVQSGAAPAPVIAGTQLGAGLLAHILVNKFVDHLPYYRQSQIFEREGVYLPDKNLSRYGLALGALLEPVAKAIKAQILQSGYAQADETHIDVLDHEKSSNTHRGQLWVLNQPHSKLTYFEYHEGRNKDAASALLDKYKGILQTDAYTCYNDHSGIHLGCMAHARRYFVKAKKLAPKECNHVIRLIGELYTIERELSKAHSNLKQNQYFEKRKQVREQRSILILDKLKLYLIDIKDKWLLEKHPMYTAIWYMLNRFEVFSIYTTDGRLQIDNNDVERMIRPIAIGRNNWMLSGSHHGATMSAVIISVLQTCKALKVNPQAYLTDVLPRLADHKTRSLQGLSPFDWK